MSRQPRAESDIQKIREKILGSALNIISEEGYQAFTMRKLASRLKMTAANIYNYYSNKDSIYLALVIEGFTILHNNISSAYTSENNPAARWQKVFDAYYRFGIAYPHHYDIMFSLPAPRYNDFVGTELEDTAAIEMDLSNRIVEIAVQSVIDAAGGENAISREEAQQRTVEAWSMLHGLLSLKNSRVLQYVITDIDLVYRHFLDDLRRNISS
ncbi:MAG: TetR/AcrR family transcriptional regulator [Spirochaetota bacterium]